MLLNSEQRPGSEVQNPHAKEIIEKLQARAAESGISQEAPVTENQEDKIELAPDLSVLKTPAPEASATVEDSHPDVSNLEKKEIVNNLLDHADSSLMSDAAIDQEEIFNYNQSE